MRRKLLALMSLVAMLVAGTGLKAQEVTIQLMPGWNWIAYPFPESVSIETAFGNFVPMLEDRIMSQFELSEYDEGNEWFGEIVSLNPGWGYMYYSNRTTAVNLVLHAPNSQVSVATATPSGITTTSAVVGGVVTVPEGGHVFLRGVCWGTEPNPDIDGCHTTEEPDVGSFSSTLEGLDSNTIYYLRAYAVTDYGLAYGEELSFTSGYEYVDLGLPSGILWATRNVGADTPEEYGDYFAWGETQPKDYYDWDTYQWCGWWFDYGFWFDKYCISPEFGITDNLTTLLPEDDAATTNWGEDWRMPTQKECWELYGNTTQTWTSQNGVYGCLFTASNGNSLFLPAAGYRCGSDLDNLGYCSYWSSSLQADPYYTQMEFAWGIEDFNYTRDLGLSVRPVRCKSSAIEVTADPSEGGSVSGGGYYMDHTSCTVSATANEGYVFANWTENGDYVSSDAAYTFVVNGNRTLVANFINTNTHTYVDLGLPSGTLWATCNVGAYLPEGYGNYFAWGETQPKDTYDWSTYQYCNGTFWWDGWMEVGLLTKYCSDSLFGYEGFIDNLTTLLPEDDAATANWGADWRMPTEEEWWELFNNTTHTWTSYHGVDGLLFTAGNDNSLFLPAAGIRYGSSLSGADSDVDYWSSSLATGVVPSSALGFFYGDSFPNTNDTFDRYYGGTVRPVRCKSSVIEVTADPSEGGSVSGGGTYMDHTSCTVSATANEGYVFANWTENDIIVSSDATYTFVVSGNRTLVAQFQQQSYTISVSANPTSGGSLSGGGTYNYGQLCTLQATANSGYTFTNWIENGEVVSTEATYSFTVDGNRNLVANFEVSSIGGHAYVDLGLPSGLLWATCNVGADNPEGYGDYFAWGEIQPKDTYNWSTYQYCNGSYNTLTKYCNNSNYGYNGFTDNLTTLLPEDDAATANWGSDWRMPTKEEWQELYNNTTCTWTTQNGVNGRLFTAVNGNSLFLPAAGCRWNDELGSVGDYGYYWSSSLDTDGPTYAWYFYFYSGNYYMYYYGSRGYGQSVRPVRSARQN